jgi:hypothetical protein
VAFAALSVLCGIGAHLASELASLGPAADGHLIFSARHVPLGLLTLASLIAFALADRRRDAHSCLCDERVCRCAGRFLPLAFAAQFLVCATTQLGEGTPIEAGDLTVGIIAALVTGALGALVIVFARRRFVGALAELFVVLLARALPAAASSWQHISAHVRVWRHRAVVFAGSRRPPPFALVIPPLVASYRSQEFEGAYFVFGALARFVRHCCERCARRAAHLCRAC